jgi:hypothetical protein
VRRRHHGTTKKTQLPRKKGPIRQHLKTSSGSAPSHNTPSQSS